MRRSTWMGALALALTLPLGGCSLFTPAPAAAGPVPAADGQRPGGQRPAQDADEGTPYDEVITEDAVTREGLFKTHRVEDDLFFEIPLSEFDQEMMIISRPVESTLQDPGGFFGGGARLLVEWEKQENHVVLRRKSYDLVADSSDAIWNAIRGFRNGAVLERFEIETVNPADSAVVIDVSGLFLTNNSWMGAVSGTQRGSSWFEHVAAFPENIEVEATQTGNGRPPGAPAAAPPSPQTVRVHWSMLKLPEEEMMRRFHDDRVGFNSSRYFNFSSDYHGSEVERFIHRFKLEPSDTAAYRRGELVEPVEPIIYWIDPATPDWMKPWVKIGVEKWNKSFEVAGFRNAIRGEYAPENDPDWSMYDLRHSAIYWRPSTVANATGGQIVDPRSGQILKGEVNMYHSIMELQQEWYFVQVGPLDPRVATLPMPDSLMGRLVEYVVTHEIGHSIGFPHNMKASAMYPADSIRSVDFLERMNGHVATLMDYSRFNYVAQPEDNIPPHLLIPNVGPYDDYAVNWGYRSILDADSPEDELATLNEWARMQDTIPWLRFTTAGAGNDPYAQTEAVGDADAVQSTTLGLLNLERVVDMLLPATEREGESYATLDDLYGGVVGQWGRYMRHVAALIGGAFTQEKLGTGERFEPVPEARQAEAVQFLIDRAMNVPDFLLREDILWRLESQGQIDRIRDSQAGIVGTMLSGNRLNTLVEYEALMGDETYTLAEYMEDIREGLWSELDNGSVEIDVYRRNLQRLFINRAGTVVSPAEADDEGWQNDVRAMMRSELRTVDGMIDAALGRAANDMTRVHLEDLKAEIEEILGN